MRIQLSQLENTTALATEDHKNLRIYKNTTSSMVRRKLAERSNFRSIVRILVTS